MEALQEVLNALSQQYISIHVFDLVKNTMTVYKSNPHIDGWCEGFDDAQSKLFNVMRNITVSESKDVIETFVNFKTLRPRLKTERMVSCIFKGKVNGWCKASFLRMDDSDPIRRVLFVVECIDAQIRRQNLLLEVSGLLADSFESVVYVDTADQAVYPVRLSPTADPIAAYLRTGPKMATMMNWYIRNAVYHEDATEMEKYGDLSFVQEELKNKQQLLHHYRTVRDGGLVEFRMKIVPFENGARLLYGFENMSEVARREADGTQTQQS